MRWKRKKDGKTRLFENPRVPCTAKIDPNGQVGALSWSLRFQRLLGGGTKTVRGRRPASRYKKLCSLNVCVGPNITVSRTPQAENHRFGIAYAGITA